MKYFSHEGENETITMKKLAKSAAVETRKDERSGMWNAFAPRSRGGSGFVEVKVMAVPFG